MVRPASNIVKDSADEWVLFGSPATQLTRERAFPGTCDRNEALVPMWVYRPASLTPIRPPVPREPDIFNQRYLRALHMTR